MNSAGSIQKGKRGFHETLIPDSRAGKALFNRLARSPNNIPPPGITNGNSFNCRYQAHNLNSTSTMNMSRCITSKPHIIRVAVLLPLLLGGSLAFIQPCAAVSFQFAPTGSLGTARFAHTATLLPNGKVLAAGGDNSVGATLSGAELYDPSSATWSATASLNTARAAHTATLLPNGKVLVAGGINSAGAVAREKLSDRSSGPGTVTGSLTTARSSHTATLLPNGKVLVA